METLQGVRNKMTEKSLPELLNFGLINIDKPSGPTSFTVSHHVCSLLELKKTSHLGTLDPQVSGVLPIALGRACKLNDVFMHRNKTYVGIMRIHSEISEETLNTEIKKFIGKIIQLPPVKSSVARREREREIFTFKILEINGKDVLFETEVQAGTYIRKLCHDIGLSLGCGAHMLELRRTQAGLFKEDKSYNLYELDSAVQSLKEGDEKPLRKMIIPAEESIKLVLPCIQVTKKKNIKQLLTGKPLHNSDFPKVPQEKFALFQKENFIGIYHPVSEGDIVARVDFVFN